MSRRPLRTAALAAWAVALGCANVEVIDPVDGSDSGYETCDAPAWADARAALERGDPVASCASLRRTVVACPDFVPAQAAWIRVALGAGGDLEAEVRTFYDELPDRVGSPVRLWARARLDRVDSRKKDLLDRAVARDPSFHYGYLDLAEVWGRSDRTAHQLEYLERAVAAKPDSPDANLALARLLVSVGRGEDAVAFFETYLRARPDDDDSVRRFVRLLVYELRRFDDAGPWIERRLAASPDDVEAMMDAAAAEWLRGERERAAVIYRRVLEKDPRDARAVLNLGNMWFRRPDREDEQRREDWRKARNAYRYFLVLDDYADMDDLRAILVSVPYRLQVIDALLGPLAADARPSRLGDF